MTPAPLFVCASHGDPSWRWLEHRVSKRYRWRFVSATPSNVLERRVQRIYVPRYRAAAEAAFFAKREHADLLITHLPLMTSYTALAATALRVRVPHLAFAFNFTVLPQGSRHTMMRHAFKHVDRFVVPSMVERTLYANHFDIPLEKIDMLRWTAQKPQLQEGARPKVAGDYLCAIGGEGRDYPTLVEAMRRLPHLKLVIVARPQNLEGLSLPSNVTALSNIPVAEAWNVLHFSKFSVVPLRDSEVPCGHVTLVAAMHMGKALVITDSAGVADYVENDVTALTSPARDAGALANRITQLWDAAAVRERLGEAAQRFAQRYCNEDATLEYFERYLRERSLLVS